MSEYRPRRSSRAPGSRSRSRSRSKARRPSLGSRRNSAKSFISISNNDTKDHTEEQNFTENIVDDVTVDIPAVAATLDHTLPTEYFKQDLLSVIQQLHITKWHRLPSHVAQDIQIKRMSGALTNAIYKVDAPSVVILKTLDLHNVYFPTLLLRVFGPNVDSIIDRDYELKILVRLSKQNIGPKLFGCFTNGRVEQFLDNAITLTKQDIMNKKTSARIARRMRELHEGIKLTKQERSEGPTAWKNIPKWIDAVEHYVNNEQIEMSRSEIFKCEFTKFKEIVKVYKKWLFAKYDDNINDHLVFCHNDTQYGNLLFTSPRTNLPSNNNSTSATTTPQLLPTTSDSTNSLTTNFSNLSLENLKDFKPSQREKKQDQNLVVIDFEYSGPNTPAYDIANHFSEWMHNYHHPTLSYAVDETHFPNLDEQFNLIYSYIIFNSNEQDISKIDKKAKQLFNECIYWRPTVSLFWALWAILQNGEKFLPTTDILEMGPNGEQYKIINEKEDESTIADDEEVITEEDQGASDVDTFDYIGYATNKLDVFFGDLVQLGLIKKEELQHNDDLKYVPTTLFKV